ncbi:MAG: GNAT family N-acetyltransferase [Lachnospiraceae bacterium]|nr:GNAT family N-acetyltransferase [Lachnospiraceae bacterium]
MDIIFLIGSGAVGKMTVGQELMKITDFRLFHNHMTIEPVLELYGRRENSLINKLREDIFEAFLRSDFKGMIFTYMWAFDMQSDWDYIKGVADKFEATGGTAYYVELVADRAVRLERNRTENRLLNKASKRDLLISDDRILREETKYRLESLEGELSFPNYLRIDNTNLEPDIVAKMIKDHFNLGDPNPKRIVDQVYFDPVRDDEIEQLHAMQVESFMPLYEVYHDEGSPAIEPVERIRRRAALPNRTYYFICVAGARVGAINIGRKDSEEDTMYISPIFILPRFQNRGYGYAAIQRAFAMHPEVKTWKLDTIKQEKRNCHLYEKCGFVRTGEEEVVNDRMTLVMYERKSE